MRKEMARVKGLEPATSGVTGRRSQRAFNYISNYNPEIKKQTAHQVGNGSVHHHAAIIAST
tara:strand:- start:4450 stop:4632 length:183 start_codon:yes stop_codon:yes gene_type:complete